MQCLGSLSCRDRNKKAEHETASWASVIMRYQESYGLWIIIAEIFSGWEAFFWRVKITPDEWTLSVTFSNRNCCQNLVSKTGNIRLISRYCTVVSRNFISSLEIQIVSNDCLFCLFSVKKRRNWHRHDYSEIDDGSKVNYMNIKPIHR